MQQLFSARGRRFMPASSTWEVAVQRRQSLHRHGEEITSITDFDTYEDAVANVIPPQEAGDRGERGRRRRPHRLVPGRCGDVRIAKARTSTSSATSAFAAPCRSRRSPCCSRQVGAARDRPPPGRCSTGGRADWRATATAWSRPATPFRSPATSARHGDTPKSDDSIHSQPARRAAHAARRGSRMPMPGSAPRRQRFLSGSLAVVLRFNPYFRTPSPRSFSPLGEEQCAAVRV